MRFRMPRLRSLAVPLENEAQRWNYVNSTVEGCLAVASIQAVASFAVVYAMELGASNAQVGLMVSMPFLANVLVILAGGRYVAGRTNILKPTCFVSAMHRVFVVCMLPAPLLPAEVRVWWVLVTYSLATAAAALTSTWWSAMMSEVYPQRHRGAVFGTRAVFTGSAGVIATLLTGQALDILPFPINYTIMFLLAAISGFIAVRFLLRTRLPVPDTEIESSATGHTAVQPVPVALQRPSWRDMMRGETGRAFAALAVPVFLFNLGFHLAAPVMNIYFVEYLHLSKGRIGLLSAVFLVCQVTSSRFWGRMGDRLGNHVVAFISMTLLVCQAALYCLVPNMSFLLLMQSVGGFAFGGFAMSTFNGAIALGNPRQRPVMISLFNVLGGLGGFLSPTAGTTILDRYGLLIAFLIAALMRAAGAVTMGVAAKAEWRQGGLAKLLYLRRFRILLPVRRSTRAHGR